MKNTTKTTQHLQRNLRSPVPTCNAAVHSRAASRSTKLCASSLRLRKSTPALLLVLLCGLVAGGCGGGNGSSTGASGSSGSGASNSHPLTQASDFNDFIAKVTASDPVALQFFQQYFPLPLSDNTAWHVNLTGASLSFTNNNPSPVQGIYKHFAIAEYPQSNANLEFTGSNSGAMTFHSLDTSNQLISDGGAQAFFATYPLDAELQTGQLKSSLLVESIVTNAGVPQYRFLQVFFLQMVSSTESGISAADGPLAAQFAIVNPLGTSVIGPIFDGTVGHALEGELFEVVLECYVSPCQTGLQLHYTDFLQWVSQ